MKLLRDLSPQLALAGIVALQISCGDSSGPGGNAAASIVAISTTALHGAPGAPVDEPPSVIVRDANGNPVSGIPVTFAVTSGGGSVTGNHPTSDAAGVATVGSWTLGPNAGTNVLVASANGLSVTFTADGADPCAMLTQHAFGTTSSGQLTASDCDLGDGSRIDLYTVVIASAGTFLFTQQGNFDTYLFLFTLAGPIVGENHTGGQVNTSVIKAILPAGTFVLGANSLPPNVTGTYTLTSAATTAEAGNCEEVFVTRGISSQQSLQSSDCTTNGFYADGYTIFLNAGQQITASMSSSAFDSYLEVIAVANSAVVVSNDNIDPTTQNAQVAFSAPSQGYYIIKARSAGAGATGAYTFAVQ